jgi:PAS domain S-box-containing protein
MSDINELTHLMELNSLILQSVGDGIYGIDKNGVTTFSNPAAENLTGWSKADLIDQNSHAVWHHSHADGSHYPAFECPIYAALHDGLVHHEQEEVFWRKDGSSFPVEYTSTPMMKGRKIVGAVVVFKDISERKKQEQHLQSALDKVKQLQRQLEAENTYLQDEIKSSINHEQIIGQHPDLLNVLEEVKQVAPTNASVLIHGETGTGKELIARAVHCGSNRREHPLIKVNCGAISQSLVESELFGHEKGAFTGAIHERQGRFELANGGTLFLDEIAELPKETQTKLLRVLQEQEFERVGGTKTIKVDVRIIAASHKNLATLSENGEFRQDLFYRLNVFPLFLPALRERKSDIPLLTDWLLKGLAKKLGKKVSGVSADSQKRMMAYPWVGNIRELQNVLERAAIMSKGEVLELTESLLPLSSNSSAGVNSSVVNSAVSLAVVEKSHIQGVLEQTGWKVSGAGGAAEILGMHPNTLRSRMEKLAIKR